MSARDDVEEPILMNCPGAGGKGNLSDGWSANCQYCHERLLFDDARIPAHQILDIIAMIKRGDFGPRSKFNRSTR